MIPYGRQNIDEDDIAAVADVLRSDFLTTGPKIAEFEKALCDYTGGKFAVACSNGTTALHLAALAADLQEGDVAIVPSLTFLATANAVRYCGADVIFADVNPDTGLMGASHFEEALARVKGKKVKAVFPVHLTGQCVDMKSISKIAQQHKIKVITDAAHAIGSVYDDQSVGNGAFEDFTTFSFHPVKTIAAGEGGAIMTNDDAAAKRMRILRSHGMVHTPSVGPWAYEMPELGFNHRMTDFQCALGLSQLKKIDGFIKRRQELVDLYDKLLAPLAPAIQTPKRMQNNNPAWHLYAPRFDFKALGIARAEFMLKLREKGVGTQVHYAPVHAQPYYKNLYGSLALPGADQYYERTLSLPLYPALRDEDVEFVVNQIKAITGV
jgi:UDP-4-amino-4,6-dideoxy-N-acetyl-beta-L-altrosamine transaminase